MAVRPSIEAGRTPRVARTTRDFMEGGWVHRHQIFALRPNKVRLPVGVIENSYYWATLLVDLEFLSLAKID
jgi:hypothetical protein